MTLPWAGVSAQMRYWMWSLFSASCLTPALNEWSYIWKRVPEKSMAWPYPKGFNTDFASRHSQAQHILNTHYTKKKKKIQWSWWILTSVSHGDCSFCTDITVEIMTAWNPLWKRSALQHTFKKSTYWTLNCMLFAINW